ncbi:hypothetical protein G6O67_007290 [Ophiocordyceps sinensis]|uniref:FYVE-type domain-containing protein n=1 Tax=Ophiocordyceps sinensis TaxID=72228 RepID=A0A8H4LUI1_9HYPO|nr:hypothetical protein G6O67_007290 [Ophiocordyceps sinensis]
MAADLAMPTPRVGELHHAWHFPPPSRPLHSRSQSFRAPPGPQISPLSISDASSNQANSTPPSPTGHYTHQGRPVYIPAVLRPCDEFPSKKIVRRKTGGSTSESDSEPPLRRVNSNIMSLPGLGALGNRLSRRPPGESAATALDGNWNLDSFPDVIALPTRRHWKLDSESSVCDDPTCKRGFSYFFRRHHCRKCGNIFCDWHSSFVLPLDQDARFNPRAALSRACHHCFQEVKVSQTRHNSHSSASTADDTQQTTASTPMMAPPAGATPTPPRGPDVAASVPRDWNWSTF